MTQRIGKNQAFGDWKLRKFLGGGGNGDVWNATSSSNSAGLLVVS
jgi:hypothetical protein